MVWNVATGQVEQTLEGHSSWVSSVAFSLDGGRLVSGSDDRTVRVWNVAIRQVEQTLGGHSSRVNSVAFSPDGGRLASGSDDRTVRVWNIATGQVEQTLEGHSSKVSSVVFSPDGGRLASGSYNGMECCHRASRADARGPYRHGLQRGILARWRQASVGII